MNEQKEFWICKNKNCCLKQLIPPINSECPLCNETTSGYDYLVTQYQKKITLSKIPLSHFSSTSMNSTADNRQENISIELLQRKFSDNKFPHSTESIGNLPNLKHRQVIWLRPEDIKTEYNKKWTVFYDPQPSDIYQGKLGNCWFISALAVIAERPDILTKIMLTGSFNKPGIYKIRLCINGMWKTVVIDDCFPCYSESNSMIFAVGKWNQLWVPLIEKALAKIHGSYASLTAGRFSEGFSILTGAPCEHIDLEVKSNQEYSIDEKSDKLEMIWGKLLSAKQANFLMGCSCGSSGNISDEEYQRLGLQKNHAYSILDVEEYGGYRLLKLRNPWGKVVWKGEWNSEWSGWNNQNKKALLYEKLEHEPGTFWIPYEKFIDYFWAVEVAHVKYDNGWNDQRFPFDISWTRTVALRVTVTEYTEISFTLFYQDARTALDNVDIMITVHRLNPDGQLGQLITNSSRLIESNVRTDDRFYEPGEYIILAISFTKFYELENLPVTLVMHSGKNTTAQLEQCEPDIFRESLVK